MQLKELGAIDDNGITEHGRNLAPLPIDAIYADLVTKMPTKALKEVMIDLTAAICTTGKLYQLTSNEEALERLDIEEPLDAMRKSWLVYCVARASLASA